LFATLLHDIKKRGSPLFLGKDHIHPFIGGVSTLEFLKSQGLLIDNDHAKVDEL
jgi:hypothetical protein